MHAAPTLEPELVVEPDASTAAQCETGERRSLLRSLDRGWEWCFGVASLIVGLAVLATAPVLQLLSLGYLLEVSGRVARTGRLSAGFIGVRPAARVGSMVLGGWLLLWLPRFASSMWESAWLMDPASPATRGWRIALVALTAWVVLHTAAACWRGGRLRRFLWPRPIKFVREAFRPGAYAAVRDAVWDFTVALRLPYYLWLGLRGFAGGLLWLVAPVGLLALGRTAPAAGIVGGLMLAAVVMYLPFLQTRLAETGRFRAMFELWAIRAAYRGAPVAVLVALVATLALALPLYLLKIEFVPREVAWLPALLFVMSIFPARLLCGWALARGKRRAQPRHWLFRHGGRLVLLPAAIAYVSIVTFTQYLSWYGVWSLYEQHAFLLPVPFLGG
jgi:hypothetical protein